MRVQRDISGSDLIKALQSFGYSLQRQKGSHATLATELNGTKSVTIPLHDPIKVGTLNSILKDIAEHHQMTRDELLANLSL